MIVSDKKQVALLFMINLTVSITTIIIFIITGVVMIKSRPKNSFVQLVDGQTIAVTTVSSYERQPQTIRKFISEVFSLMFSWTGFLPNEGNIQNQAPIPDLGVPISQGKRVPTVAMYSSFAFSEKIRNPMLEQIAQLTPQTLFGAVPVGQVNTKPRILLLIEYIGDPQPKGIGRWEVELVSSLVIFEPSTPQGRLLSPFNKIVTVRAVEPITKMVENPAINLKKVESNEKINTEMNPIYIEIDEIIRNIRQSGLQIIDMKELN